VHEGLQTLGSFSVGHPAEQAPVVDVLKDQGVINGGTLPPEQGLDGLGELQALVRRDAGDESQ
jgi:hypothetical protein